MIELAKHIEYLLLENDCVVVPELGGFITHHQPAHYEEAEGFYLPPVRTIGFNPQLTMNDGLLVQSYMQAYHTDFPDATRKIQQAVSKMKSELYSEGVVEMHGIGTLHYNIRGLFEFHPDESGVLSPSLYALDGFRMQLLAPETVSVMEVKEQESPQKVQTAVKKPREFHLDTRWLGNAVAVVIAAVLFFTLSAPVENTYIDKGNYASLGTENLFDAIRSHSMATVLVAPVIEQPQRTKKQEIKPVAVRVEKVAPAVKVEEPKEIIRPVKEEKIEEVKKTVKVDIPAKAPVASKTKTNVLPQKKYHLIVASLATSKDAQHILESYRQKGYTEASVVEGSGRFRISLYNYSDRATANNKLNELKKEEAYKTAWLLTSK